MQILTNGLSQLKKPDSKTKPVADGIACGGLRLNSPAKATRDGLPLVTIVTVVFNAVDLIEKTIRNVAGQSYQNIEYIIIDGGSGDGTLEIIKKYEDIIDLWASEKDSGIYYAMNKGIEFATGQWINFMNAGDRFYDDNTISNVIKSIEDSSELVYGKGIMNFGGAEGGIWQAAKKNYWIKQPSEVDADGSQLVYWWDGKAKPEDLWKRMICSHQALFMRTSLAKKMKFDTKLSITADFEMIFKSYICGYTFQRVDIPVAVILAGGLSGRNFKKRTLERWQVVRKYKRGLRVGIHYTLLLLGHYLPGSIVTLIKKTMNLIRDLFR